MRWITALMLQHWADTLAARTTFPGLVADLIRASATNITNIRFPSGDKGQVRGFDGVLEATGVTPYVPDGKSIWEFGVNEAAAAKADLDYTKRTKEVAEAERKEATFVFVTPRTWDNPKKKLSEWVEEKRGLGEWKSVEYLDGSMLEDWLFQCPAVAAMYAKYVLGTMPNVGVRSTDQFWDEYSTRFEPALVEQVLLAGREALAESLVQLLMSGSSKLPYVADSPDEVIAFAVAAIRRAEPAVRLYLEARSLIVDTKEAARQLSSVPGLVFMPQAGARELAGLLMRQGPTVVSAGVDELRHGHVLLVRPNSSELAKAFTFMGFTEQEGYDIARKCGRSLAVLARQRPSGTATKPEWLEKGHELLPALLAGAWHASTLSDQQIVCRLSATKDYADVEAPLRKLAKLQDPPIDRIGDVWSMRAPIDAFVHLGHLIGAEHLERFSAAANDVLAQTVLPPKAEDVFKPATARSTDTHSRWLRDGMTNTLLHMAVLHAQAEFTVAGMTPQEFVNDIVRRLPGLSTDHRLLASIQDQIPMLAEAAPIPFVEALECLLKGDAAGIRPIFEEHIGFIGSHSDHLGVLRGLELIAWDPQLLLRVSTCLAKLAEIDPGGSIANRPINSLRSIFLSWAPNTSATSKQRMGVLARILGSVPSIAWQLVTKLLPSDRDISVPTQQPAFREYGEHEREVLTYGIVWENQAFVIDHALRLAGLDPERWVTLITAITQFPEQSFNGAIKALENVLMSTSSDARFAIWDALHKETKRHRSFFGTDWALPEEPLSQLESLVQNFKPNDAVARSIWLFDDWMPDVPGWLRDDEDPEEVIDTVRADAIREVMHESGISGLIKLARKAKLPAQVAFAIRRLEFEFDVLLEFFVQALNVGEYLDDVAGAVLAEGVSRFEAKWMRSVLELLLEQHVASERIAKLLTSLKESMETWIYIETFGNDVADAYWRKKYSSPVKGSVNELLFAIDNYLARNRNLAALDAASRRMPDVKTTLLMTLLDKSVQEINALERRVGAMSLHSIEKAFEELRTRQDISLDDIAALEFRYLPVFSVRKKPLVLHALVVQRPQLFMDMICTVFKPASGEAESPAGGDKKLAIAAYELLTGIRVLPGQTGDDISEQELLSWCNQVRAIAIEVDRAKIVDQRIGALFSHAPPSNKDGAWPHESVRSVIEQIGSDELEYGVVIERFNMRGPYRKAMGEGGGQERALAKQSREWADLMPKWPRVAAMLIRITECWQREAEREDLGAQKDALRW